MYSDLMLKYEEKLREAESEAQGIKDDKIDTQMLELSRRGFYKYDALEDIRNKLRSIRYETLKEIQEKYAGWIKDAAEELDGWSGELLYEIDRRCGGAQRIPGIGNVIECHQLDTHVMKKNQNKLRTLLGKECGFITEDSSKLITAVDSFTNCLHTFALELSEIENKNMFDSDSLCKGYTDEFKDSANLFCEAFSDGVNTNKYEYQPVDSGMQKVTVTPGRIDVSVGGEVGHKTVINLKDKVVEYNDHFEPRAHIVWDVLNRVGMSCNLYGTRVRCEYQSDDQLRKLGRALSMLPSLDIILSETRDNLRMELYDEAREIAEERLMDEIEAYADEVLDELVENKSNEILQCTTYEITNFAEERDSGYYEMLRRCF